MHVYLNMTLIYAPQIRLTYSFIKLNDAGWFHNPKYKLADWMHNGIYRMPERDTSIISTGLVPNDYNYVDELCLDNQFSFESRIKFPVDSAHLEQYLRKQGGSTLSNMIYGSELQSFYFDNLKVNFWIARGSWAHPNGIDSMYAYTQLDANGVIITDHRNLSTGKYGVGKNY